MGRAIGDEPILADIIQSRRHEYGEAARNAGERGPRKVPEAFAKQKTRGPWPKGGTFKGNKGV